MATAAAALYKTATSTAKRESLDDIIYQVDSDETPFMSTVKKGTASAITEEWLVQELAAASAVNYVNEGADTDYQAQTAHTRFTNLCMISQKGVSISGTLSEVKQAGVSNEMNYRQIIAGKELRRDLEKYFTDGEVVKSATDPRKSGAISTWLSNSSFGSGGAVPTGDGTAAGTNGTARALTLALVEAAHGLAWADGGAPTSLLLSATNKQNFSALTSSVTNQLQMTSGKPVEGMHVGSISVFLTDYGQLDVTMSRQLSNDKALLLDYDWLEYRTLPNRNFAIKDMAANGDSVQKQIVVEGTLCALAPKSSAQVVALNGS
jgi:hypothetical protein|tara:strand:- start:1183 stop:2142 length:960 start_codon:yes stop_codon:yes gene_type:complete